MIRILHDSIEVRQVSLHNSNLKEFVVMIPWLVGLKVLPFLVASCCEILGIEGVSEVQDAVAMEKSCTSSKVTTDDISGSQKAGRSPLSHTKELHPIC